MKLDHELLGLTGGIVGLLTLSSIITFVLKRKAGGKPNAVVANLDARVDMGQERLDRILPYVTGGLAVGNVKNSISGFGDSSTTKAGYALGGGVEAALAGPWTAKVEYLYADLGRSSAPLGTDA